jgi:hypothetical protein
MKIGTAAPSEKNWKHLIILSEIFLVEEYYSIGQYEKMP